MSLYVSCEILTCGGIVIVNCDVVCGRGHTSTGTGHTSTGIQKQEGRLSCYVRYYRLSQAREKLSS